MLKLYPALNTHDEYLQMLAQLEKQTTQIEYALVDKNDTKFIELFTSDIVWKKETKQWWATTTSRKTQLYRVKASGKLFKALRKYETFFHYYVSERCSGKADVWEETDFGLNDIAFFDNIHHEPLLYTTTHEGILCVSDALKLNT